MTAIDQGQLASYANRGSFVSLGAPGTSIVYFNNEPWYGARHLRLRRLYQRHRRGLLDTTHNSVSQAQAFLRSNFGVKITPSQ